MRIDRVKLVTQMAECEISAKELAKKAGISHNTISGIRAGRSCTEQTAQALADALNVDLVSLIEQRKGLCNGGKQ